MADCYYHGHSGGPGPCSECEREDRNKMERGSIIRPADEMMTQEETLARDRGMTLEELRKRRSESGS